MANINAPFGFQHVGDVGGGDPTYQQAVRLIASTDANACFTGDPVMPVTGSATGYVTRLVPGTVEVVGVAAGFQWNSVSLGGQLVTRPYYPGSDAQGDVTVFIIDSPNAIFRVQSDATGLPFSKVGQNVQVSMGSGTTATGQSTAVVTGPATTATLPFTVRGVVTDPPGLNGTDPTTGYNIVNVSFNNQTFKQLTGIS